MQISIYTFGDVKKTLPSGIKVIIRGIWQTLIRVPLLFFFSLEFVYAGDPNLSIIIPVVKAQGVVQMARKNDRPPQERYSMTIEEAAGYSLIGENRLRRIIEEDRTLDWVFRVGSQVRIKRVLFEKWLDGKYNL